jgi:hypothetical protein
MGSGNTMSPTNDGCSSDSPHPFLDGEAEAQRGWTDSHLEKEGREPREQEKHVTEEEGLPAFTAPSSQLLRSPQKPMDWGAGRSPTFTRGWLPGATAPTLCVAPDRRDFS